MPANPVLTLARASCAPPPQQQPDTRAKRKRTCTHKPTNNGSSTDEHASSTTHDLPMQDGSSLISAISCGPKKKGKKQKRKHIRAVLKGALRCQRGHKLKLQHPPKKRCFVSAVVPVPASTTLAETLLQPGDATQETGCTQNDIDAVLQLLAKQAARRYATAQTRLRRRYYLGPRKSSTIVCFASSLL